MSSVTGKDVSLGSLSKSSPLVIKPTTLPEQERRHSETTKGGQSKESVGVCLFSLAAGELPMGPSTKVSQKTRILLKRPGTPFPHFSFFQFLGRSHGREDTFNNGCFGAIRSYRSVQGSSVSKSGRKQGLRLTRNKELEARARGSLPIIALRVARRTVGISRFVWKSRGWVSGTPASSFKTDDGPQESEQDHRGSRHFSRLPTP